jgi:mono/diheme cytochrome c family protein
MHVRAPSIVFAVVALAAGLGCRQPSTGFRLPHGDAVRGQAVFTEMRCHACHEVPGANLPAPVADPPVRVALGGVVSLAPTEGELVAAIVHPSSRLAIPARGGLVRSGGLSRMGDFTEALSARDLVDLVAFLQTRYDVIVLPAGP